MPVLKMYVNKIFLAKKEIDFREMETVDERQSYVDNLATVMYWEHYVKIDMLNKSLDERLKPIIFYDLQSKVSDWTDDELFKTIENEEV